MKSLKSRRCYYERRYAAKCSGEIPRVRWLRVVDNLSVLKRLSKQLRDTDRMLVDVGCGFGLHLAFCKARAIGIDLSTVAIGHGIGWGVVADGAALPLEEGIADVCTCIETLEHIPRDEVEYVLKELLRICKPGGTLMITVPNEYEQPPPLLRSVSAFFTDAGHLTRFRRKELRDILSQVGFNNIYMRSSGYWLLGLLLVLERSRIVARFGKVLKFRYGPISAAVTQWLAGLLNLESRLFGRAFPGLRMELIAQKHSSSEVR